MVRNSWVLFTIFSFSLAFSQAKEGFWDNMRATEQTIILKTKERKIVQSEAFPVGTTEIVFRITVLDDNQQLSSSLVSLLKSIPDPTGVSQGSAGALYLLSTIVGKDQCTFKVFASQKEAEKYQKEGHSNAAIYQQDLPTNKEIKLLKNVSSYAHLWFVFESDNWFLKEKIAIEVVPWVNYKERKGWNSSTKSKVISLIKQQEIYQEVSNKEEFTGQFLNMVMEKYSFSDFSELLAEEKKQVLSVFTEKSLTKIGERVVLTNLIRKKAKNLFEAGKRQEAIDLLIKELIDKKQYNILDFNTIGKYLLITNQLDKAESFLLKGIELDGSELHLRLNLAHVYLLKNEFSKAKEIHKTYKNQNITTETTWVQQALIDLDELEKAGFASKDFKKIRKTIQ